MVIYPYNWNKPIQVITFMDTGAAGSMFNPSILPKEQWVLYLKHFNTASKGAITAKAITKDPIMIEFFLGVQFWTRILRFVVPGADLINGFGIYKQFNNWLKVRTQGITFKNKFKSYTNVIRLFPIIEEEQIKDVECQLVKESCVDSYKEFMKKHIKPLWLNEEFFIRFLF